MNRRKVEGIIWFVAGFILILLLANKSKMLSDNVGENIFSLILSGITLFFGKMTWFIAIVSMLYGIILFFYEKIGINITQGKVVALTGLFLSWGMILIRGSVVHGKTLSGNFTEAGRQLLEIGFNRESGGILGALLSMPFFKVLHFQWMFFILLILALLFVAWLVRDLIELGYEVLKEIIKYYKSDDYKEKKRKLAAKKYAENLKRTDYKRYQKEMLKAKIIQSRNEKLSFEIAKKPKKNFLQKTEVYSKGELAEKEKEWIEIFEENEKQKILENAKKTENKEKNDKEEQETETKNTINNEEQEAPEPKKPEEIKEEDKNKIREMLVLRAKKRKPLQYILGEWEFYGLPFKVSEGVLIPRADTEILVEQCIQLMRDIEEPNILDIGSGSGAISIAIANELKSSSVTGIDINEKALKLANENKILNEIENVNFVESNLFKKLDKDFKYDLIVSNPPYISKEEYETLMPEVKNYEPQNALTDLGDGLYFYREISKLAGEYLKDTGYLAYEIGYNQAKDVTKILQNNNFDILSVIKDYGGNDRVVIAKKAVKTENFEEIEGEEDVNLSE